MLPDSGDAFSAWPFTNHTSAPGFLWFPPHVLSLWGHLTPEVSRDSPLHDDPSPVSFHEVRIWTRLKAHTFLPNTGESPISMLRSTLWLSLCTWRQAFTFKLSGWALGMACAPHSQTKRPKSVFLSGSLKLPDLGQGGKMHIQKTLFEEMLTISLINSHLLWLAKEGEGEESVWGTLLSSSALMIILGHGRNRFWGLCSKCGMERISFKYPVLLDFSINFFFFLFIIFFYLRSLLLSLFSLENVNSTNVPYSPGSFPPMFKIALTFLISELLLCPSIKQMIIFEKYLTSIWADLPSLICVCAPTP